eukprot:CAMPEP_0198298338 /NCGR_PEP_ID=MMETSP1449-20131203/40604_1 /TAXON_ID=420275 /ORGANISM="Attheya septentrionalis, Strain CCMP2084" /LENGTH=252 /DNA_ID=CAMNT_0043999585 /DNA_START=28 /DNA_END=783 /DNA_ORIENTATION=-
MYSFETPTALASLPSVLVQGIDDKDPHLSCQDGITYRQAGLPPIKDRKHIPRLLQARGFTDGAEIGVKYGRHAHIILSQWASCKSFRLIDLWQEQENYIDGSNANNVQQDQRFEGAKSMLAQWKDKTTFLRMLSTEAAKTIPAQSLDYIYIDARHDYCGVKEDMEAYYPKLRPGGIMAGHDFMYSSEVAKGHGNWSICEDGSVHPGAVRGAVQEFAESHGLVVSVMYREGGFNTWMTQKPTKSECVKESGKW